MASHPRHDKSRLIPPPPPAIISPTAPPAAAPPLSVPPRLYSSTRSKNTACASVLFRSTWSNGSTHKTQCRPDKGGIVAFTTCQPSVGTAFSLPNSTVKCYCAINGERPYCTSNGSPVTRGKSLPARNTIFRLPPSPYIWTFTSSSANLKTRRSASGQLSSSGK